MMRKQTNRFSDLVHYVCEIARDKRFGAVKLNKMLWYIDTLSYKKWGASISGETAYIKRQHGPVGKTTMKTLAELEKKGVLSVRRRHESVGVEYTSLAELKPNPFTDDERELIRSVVEDICDNHTANSISERSHTGIWEVAMIGEEIPLCAVLVDDDGEIKNKHKKWADKAIAALSQ